jgi:PAS domain S-box-containing protein
LPGTGALRQAGTWSPLIAGSIVLACLIPRTTFPNVFVLLLFTAASTVGGTRIYAFAEGGYQTLIAAVLLPAAMLIGPVPAALIGIAGVTIHQIIIRRQPLRIAALSVGQRGVSVLFAGAVWSVLAAGSIVLTRPTPVAQGGLLPGTVGILLAYAVASALQVSVLYASRRHVPIGWVLRANGLWDFVGTICVGACGLAAALPFARVSYRSELQSVGLVLFASIAALLAMFHRQALGEATELRDAVADLLRAPNLSELLTQLADRVARIAKPDLLWIVLRRGGAPSHVAAARGLEPDVLERLCAEASGRGLGWALEVRETECIDDYRIHPRWNEDADHLLGQGRIRSLIVAPLVVANEVLGTLVVTKLIPHYFTATQQQSITALSAQAALIMRNAALLAEVSQARDELQELAEASQALHRSLELSVKSARIGIWELDISNNTIIWDAYTGRLFGLAPGAAPGSLEGFLDLVHPENQEGLVREVWAAVEQGTPFDTEFRVVWPDGSVHFLATQAQVYCDDANTPVRLTGASWDVTERRQAEEAARDTAERYRSLVEGVPVGVYRRTVEGEFLEANDSLVRIFGYPDRSAFMKMDVAALYLDPSEPKRLRALLERDGVANNFEAQMHHYDGSIIWTRTNIRGIRDASGRVVRLEGIVEDITAQKRMAEEARRAGEAEAANRAKSEFLSRMSHELRTPLNAILGFGQLLEMDSLTAEQRENVDTILTAGRHLLNLINEVLDISRVESDRLHLSLEPIAVTESIEEALRLIHPAAARAGIALIFDKTASRGEYIVADNQRLKQVLLNLLGNAVKYNRREGTVTIACRNVPGSRLRISIADTGPGIAPEKMPRLFSPFDRLGAEQTVVEGTGLGLTLSKRLVEGMGGVVGVESTVGEGSTFWVEFALVEEPVREAERQEIVYPPPTGATASKPAQVILYIEDNMSNLKVIQHLLARRPGVKLIPAMQGRLGVDLAREHRPNLILLDLHLPDLSGAAVLGQLRNMPETRHTPVIMLSADTSPGQIDRLLGMGAVDYLTKPIDVKKLLEVIAITLGPH